MKATTLLKRQHRQAEKLFEQLEHAEVARRDALVHQLADELAAHMAIEEQFFYPATRAILDDPTLVEVSFLEHQIAKLSLRKLISDSTLSFEAKLKVLKNLVEHHIMEEEEVFFPRVEELMDEDQLKMLGSELKVAYEQARKAGYEKFLPQHASAGTAPMGSEPTDIRSQRVPVNGVSRRLQPMDRL